MPVHIPSIAEPGEPGKAGGQDDAADDEVTEGLLECLPCKEKNKEGANAATGEDVLPWEF